MTEAQNTEATEQQSQEDEQAEAKTFDADYVDKLRKEAAKYRTEAKANADAAKRLADLENANKSEAEKLAARAETAERELVALQQNALRVEVALEKGLSASQAKRLIGSSREELEADADELLKDLGAAAKPRAPKPDLNQGRSSSGTASTADLFAAAVEGQFTR